MTKISLKATSDDSRESNLLFEKHSCHGRNVNPSIKIENVPAKGKSVVVIMESIDQNNFVRTHWVSWNIPATGQIMENESRGENGRNDFGGIGYWGPGLAQSNLKFTFRIYVLDRFLNFPNSERVSKFDIYSRIVNYGLGHGKFDFQFQPKKEENYPSLIF